MASSWARGEVKRLCPCGSRISRDSAAEGLDQVRMDIFQEAAKTVEKLDLPTLISPVYAATAMQAEAMRVLRALARETQSQAAP